MVSSAGESRPYVHPLSDVQTSRIGAGTRIWQFCVVLPDASIGAECNICSHVFIENNVHIGDRVTVKNGVHLYDGLVLEDDVFVGPGVVFTNDRHPRSRMRPSMFEPTRICRGASIGGGAVILPGITIGEGAMVGAGALVLRDVAPRQTVVGNPARPLDR